MGSVLCLGLSVSTFTYYFLVYSYYLCSWGSANKTLCFRQKRCWQAVSAAIWALCCINARGSGSSPEGVKGASNSIQKRGVCIMSVDSTLAVDCHISTAWPGQDFSTIIRSDVKNVSQVWAGGAENLQISCLQTSPASIKLSSPNVKPRFTES